MYDIIIYLYMSDYTYDDQIYNVSYNQCIQCRCLLLQPISSGRIAHSVKIITFAIKCLSAQSYYFGSLFIIKFPPKNVNVITHNDRTF